MARLNFKNDLIINIKLDFTAMFSPAFCRCYKRDCAGGSMWTFMSPRIN